MISLNKALIRELSLLPDRSRIMVIGEPDTGKSTIVAAMARWFRNKAQKVAVVDSDMGQSDIGPPGFISYGIVEQDVISLQSIISRGSYLVGKTSPFGKELSIVMGTKICTEAAQHRETDVILIDTCGLVRPPKGVQLKCAKAEALKPDLILALNTPEIAPLVSHLNLLGFRVRNFLPLKRAQTRTADERKKNRISIWNTYIGDNPSLLDVRYSRVKIRRWWDESRYMDTDVDRIPHGTVVGVHDPETPGFQVPCIWTVLEGNPFILTPLSKDYKLDTVWITAYKLGLNGNTVISA